MGRAVRPGDPVWTEEDTLLAVEWQRLQSEICGGCGHPLEESLDEGTDYEAQRITCFACQAKEKAERVLSEKDNADLSGMKVTAVRTGHRPLLDDN